MAPSYAKRHILLLILGWFLRLLFPDELRHLGVLGDRLDEDEMGLVDVHELWPSNTKRQDQKTALIMKEKLKGQATPKICPLPTFRQV
jgi:hypothetical protein